MDLETTGLDVETCSILEIATIVTDKDLNVLEEGPDLVIHQPDPILGSMDPWCITQHGATGLIDASRRSTVTLEVATEETLSFLLKHCPKGMCPLCGNSICFDRRFLMRHMPQIDAFLNYRQVDVSSIKELVARWYPELIRSMSNEKTSAHRALQDIQESIAELRTYRAAVFREKVHGNTA
jgi:oligoribonuclease